MIPRKNKEGPFGFSLLELLVAMAILSIMMTFLFNLVAQTMRAWESGARRVEAAQAARIGLDFMARELQSAFGGVGVAFSNNTPTLVTNYIPFFASNGDNSTRGLPAPTFRAALGSGQLFAVAPVAEHTNSFGELGYLCVYVSDRGPALPGYHNLMGYRYYLLRHTSGWRNEGGSTNTDFYFRDPPTPGWETYTKRGGGMQDNERSSLINNCYQISFSFASNNNDGRIVWVDDWPSQTTMPDGVLVTAKVIDEKTAARLEVVLNKQPLNGVDLEPGSETVAGRILREGTVEVRRFIPFVNNSR